MYKVRKEFGRFTGLVRNTIAMLHDSAALSRIAPLHEAYLPWTRASIRPPALEVVLNAIYFAKPQYVVEFGPGNSTFFICNLLKKIGSGRLIAFEEKVEWADLIKKEIDARRLTDFCEVVYAPLAATSWNDVSGEWYDTEIVGAALEVASGSIQTVLIDGPTGLGASSDPSISRRVFALPNMVDKVARERLLLIDDTNRRGEMNCVDMWERHLGVSFKRFGISGGFSYNSTLPFILE